jgi:hypothetical protein
MPVSFECPYRESFRRRADPAPFDAIMRH